MKSLVKALTLNEKDNFATAFLKGAVEGTILTLGIIAFGTALKIVVDVNRGDIEYLTRKEGE